MSSSPQPQITVVAPTADIARRVLRSYFDDIVSRYHGRAATDDEVTAAMRDEPSDNLAPPSGLFLIAREQNTEQGTEQGAEVGCVGLRLVDRDVAEVTRLFVRPAARRRGLAQRLLTALEGHARQRGISVLRLDTRRDLTEARQLYAKHGYREVPPFSDGPYVDHCFEKSLSEP